MRAPAFAFALAFALAGCLGSALATAMEARDPADEAARLWNDDARLAGALGIEGTGPLAAWAVAFLTDVDVDEARGDGEDRDVGDGRAQAWVYKYVAEGEEEAYVVIVDREGDVRSARTVHRDRSDVALDAWVVDSDDALQIARDADQGLREGLEREDYGILAALASGDDGPVWHVVGGGRDATGGGMGYVRIDAASGEVIENAGFFADR